MNRGRGGGRYWNSVLTVAVLILLVFVIGTDSLRAADKPTSRGNKSTQVDDMGSITPEREAAALKFAELHHPQLVGLLGTLKQGNPNQFRKAAQEIFRVSERLARIKDRQPQRYEYELQIWKATSRSNLLIASLPMSPQPEKVLQEIETLLQNKYDAEIGLQEHQAAVLRDRLEKMEMSTERIRRSKDKTIQNQIQRLKKRHILADEKELPQN